MKELIKPDGSKTGIFVIEVPEDASNIYINESQDRVNYNCRHFAYKQKCLTGKWIPKKGNWVILGTATSESIDFDVSGLLDVDDVQNDIKMYSIYGKVYNNQIEHARILSTSNAEQSFRSLLAHNGLYWVNPSGSEKPKNTGQKHHRFAGQTKRQREWQALEDKKITGKLLFIQNKKH